ncbi:hypothetical protein BGZ46_008280 [Entomortierella lignicola]|nr:hypothetical protein BGZ46_008280 [Entomortierella lignicola]
MTTGTTGRMADSAGTEVLEEEHVETTGVAETAEIAKVEGVAEVAEVIEVAGRAERAELVEKCIAKMKKEKKGKDI